MRRLLVGRVPASTPSQGEEGDPQADRRGRDGAGDEDPSGVSQLASRRVTDRRHQVAHGAVAGQPRRETGFEARPGRQRAKRGAHHRGGINQRRQLWPHGELASGQEAIDGLIEAFGGRAG
jgi:hypothetical protein